MGEYLHSADPNSRVAKIRQVPLGELKIPITQAEQRAVTVIVTNYAERAGVGEEETMEMLKILGLA